MPINEQAWKVISSFQRYLKSGDDNEIKQYSILELRSTDEQLGNKDVNSGWRLAIQNRINDSQQKEQRKHESKIRAWQVIVSILVALLIAGLTTYLYGT